MIWPAAFGAVALFLAAGWGATSPVRSIRTAPLAARLAWAWAAGVAGVAGLLYAASHVAGVPLTRPWVLAAFAIVAAPGPVARVLERRGPAPGPRPPRSRPHPLAVALAAFAAVVTAGLLADAVTSLVLDWDGRMHWMTHARYVRAEHRVDARVLREERWAVVQPRYPLLLQVAQVAAEEAVGSDGDERVARPLYAAFFPALVALAWDGARRLAGPRAAALAGLLAAALPQLSFVREGGAASAYSDLPLALFLGGGLLLLATGRGGAGRGLLAGLLLGGAVLTKSEGLWLAAAVLAATLPRASARLRRGARSLAAAWPCALVPFLLAVWLYLSWRSGVADRFLLWLPSLPAPGGLAASLAARLPVATRAVGLELANADRWGLFWIVLAGLAVLGWRGAARPAFRPFLAVTACGVALYLGAYAVTAIDLASHVRTTWSRLLSQLAVPLLVPLAAVVRAGLEAPGPGLARWKRSFYDWVAAEVSATTCTYDRVVQLWPSPGDTGYLLSRIEAPDLSCVPAGEEAPDLSSERDRRTALLLNGTFNAHLDIQGLLYGLLPRLSRTSRVVVVTYNYLFAWLFRLADRLDLRDGPESSTFLTRADLDGIARLSGFEVVRSRTTGYAPGTLLGLGWLANKLFPAVPGLRRLGLVEVVTLRPVIAEERRPSLTIVIPARNEAGNIESAVRRLPDLGTELDVIFVEGHSTDGTWDEIQRVLRQPSRERVTLRAYRQQGKGKADAVRLGLSVATGELVAILDADLTMPPEMLVRFYEAYRAALADFVNGSRLLYPMEGEAMRFLNRLGNIFFAKALSRVLGTRISDSLCGTKLLARHDYERFTRWRRRFGDFDPFGDFELLFPASELALGVVDVPIRYRARTYGSTSISRFRHGLMLARMTVVGFLRLRLGRVPRRHDVPAPGGA